MCSATEPRHPVCSAPPNGITVGHYAAQLSWWFSFFSPDRFLILSSTDVQDKDPEKQVSILNKIKAFAGVSGDDFEAPELNKELVENVSMRGAYTNSGKYDLSKLGMEDAKALLMLRLLSHQPLADLRALLRKHYQPDFPDLNEEISEATLRLLVKERSDQIIGAGRLRPARTAGRAFRLRVVRARHVKIRSLLRSSDPTRPAALPAQLVGAVGPDTNRTRANETTTH